MQYFWLKQGCGAILLALTRVWCNTFGHKQGCGAIFWLKQGCGSILFDFGAVKQGCGAILLV